MKKIIALLLATLCIFACCSCAARPAMKLDEAEANLKAKNYIVVYNDNEEILGVKATATLSATKGSDQLYVTVYATTKLARFAYEMAKLEQDNKIELLEMEIKEAEYTLKKFRDEMTSFEIDRLEDGIEEKKSDLNELKNSVIGRSGKTFWKGTKQAIKDSRK